MCMVETSITGSGSLLWEQGVGDALPDQPRFLHGCVLLLGLHQAPDFPRTDFWGINEWR